MTYQNDPNLNRDPIRPAAKDNTGIWIAGIVGLCLVLGLLFWGMRGPTNTAVTNNNRPAASTPATTTGSGVTPSAIPANPSGTVPQKDPNQPAPAPRPNQ